MELHFTQQTFQKVLGKKVKQTHLDSTTTITNTKMHKGVCLLLALFVCWVNAATIQYNYTAGSTATYNWVDAATWIGGVVPGAGDDVDILLVLSYISSTINITLLHTLCLHTPIHIHS